MSHPVHSPFPAIAEQITLFQLFNSCLIFRSMQIQHPNQAVAYFFLDTEIWLNYDMRKLIMQSEKTMNQQERPRYFVHSLEKGLAILAAFSKKGPKLTLSEIAQVTDMVPPTATRFIRTLEDLGYLTRDPATKSYSLSPKVLSLGFNLLKNMDLRGRVTPFLAEVTHEFGVGSQCAILDGTEIVYIERLRSLSLVSLDLTIGSRLPAYCTALGRVILAFMDPKAVKDIVAKTRMTPLTSHTIVDENDFYRELELIRKRGYSINMQELVLGQAALAAPIFHSGVVEGALGFAFPHTFMKDSKFNSDLVKRMMQIADKVSLG